MGIGNLKNILEIIQYSQFFLSKYLVSTLVKDMDCKRDNFLFFKNL